MEVSESEFREVWLEALNRATGMEGLSHAAVARELSMSEDAYNKCRRGDRNFSWWAFALLCQRFALPRHPAEVRVRQLRFESPFANAPKGSRRLDHYVEVLNGLTDLLTDTGPETQVWVSTTDVPIPYFFAYPTLRAIKLYFFATSARGFTWPTLEEFRSRVVGEAKLSRLSGAFLACRRNEIWGMRPLDSARYQIDYLLGVGAISVIERDRAADELATLIEEIRRNLGDSLASAAEERSLTLYTEGSASRPPSYVLEAGARSLAIVTDDPPYFTMAADAETVAARRRAIENRLALATDVAAHGHTSIRRFVNTLRGSDVDVAMSSPAIR